MDDNFYSHSIYKNWSWWLLEDSAHSSDVKTSSDGEIISRRSTAAHCCPISHQLILCVWKSAPPPQSSTLRRQFPTIQSPASLSPTEVSQIEQLTAAACFGKAAYLSSWSSSFNMQRCSSPALGAVRGSAGRRLVLLSADIRGGGGRLPSQWTLWRATQETATRPQHAE